MFISAPVTGALCASNAFLFVSTCEAFQLLLLEPANTILAQCGCADRDQTSRQRRSQVSVSVRSSFHIFFNTIGMTRYIQPLCLSLSLSVPNLIHTLHSHLLARRAADEQDGKRKVPG